jgi:hypothetical protein
MCEEAINRRISRCNLTRQEHFFGYKQEDGRNQGGTMIFVGKSFKVESLTKTFASSIVVCEEEFQLCHKALLCQSMYKP